MHLEIETTNAAFDDPNEVPRLLREVATKIEAGKDGGIIRDVNGNKVGGWSA
jgi:hypothetical protein